MEKMLNIIRCNCKLALLCLAFLGVAWADVTPAELTTNLSMKYPSSVCSVSAYGNEPGSPAYGAADFTSLKHPWTYTFRTADPLSYKYDDNTGYYYASFGSGGYFSMSGPYGLTFTGRIKSGYYYSGGPALRYGVNLLFTGQWSNGMVGHGTLTEAYSEEAGSEATLKVLTS